MLNLQKYMQSTADWISSHLLSFLPHEVPKTLYDAMAYSINAGGKKIRPILLISTLEALGKPKELGLEVACAIEMIHTYSLIHDDLPAMDNDDFRRGRPTNHKVFGEGIAILAGDGLLTWAFHLLSSIHKIHPSVAPEEVLELIQELSIASGPAGMVGGQVYDLEGENKQLTLDELEKIHRHKTGDLIHYSVYAGAILANATPIQRNALSIYARKLGLAFQIQDDILDVIGDQKNTGKAVGSDQRLGKSTYPSLLGIEQAKTLLSTIVDEAKNALNVDGIDKHMLVELANFFVNRNF